MVHCCEAMGEELSVLRRLRELFDCRDRSHVVQGDAANVTELAHGWEMEVVRGCDGSVVGSDIAQFTVNRC